MDVGCLHAFREGIGLARGCRRRHPGASGGERDVRFPWLPWLSPHRRARREEELDEELRAHLRMAEEDRIADGESSESAAAAARREFGNLALIREITREAWGGVRLG